MKVFVILLLSTLIFSCNTPSTLPFHPRRDTAITVALYARFDWAIVKCDPVFRVINDSVTYRDEGSKATKVISRDTSYYIPDVDTVKEKGIVMKDSTGRVKTKMKWLLLPRGFLIQDFNKDIMHPDK